MSTSPHRDEVPNGSTLDEAAAQRVFEWCLRTLVGLDLTGSHRPDGPRDFTPATAQEAWREVAHGARALLSGALGDDDGQLYAIDPAAMRWGSRFVALRAVADRWDDARLVHAFALRGWRVASSPAVRTPTQTLRAYEAVIRLRQSGALAWMATQGWIKPYTERSTAHYHGFARGPLHAYAILAEDYVPRARRGPLGRWLRRKALRLSDAPSLDALDLHAQLRLTRALIMRDHPHARAINGYAASVIRASSLDNYANLHRAMLRYTALHALLHRALRPVPLPLRRTLAARLSPPSPHAASQPSASLASTPSRPLGAPRAEPSSRGPEPRVPEPRGCIPSPGSS